MVSNLINYVILNKNIGHSNLQETGWNYRTYINS